MMIFQRSLTALYSVLLVLAASPVWAKEDEPAPPTTPFFASYMLVGLFIVLGVMAVVRSTARTPGEDD